MSDPLNPAAAQVVAPAADAQQAPAQPAQAAAAQPTTPVKAEPRKLPYAAPVRGNAQPATVAQPASSEPVKDESKGKPVASRALAMAKSQNAKLTADLEAARKSASQVESMRKVLAGYADEAIKGLSPEWQAHLKELAGDDPARLLELARKTAGLRPQASAQVAPQTTLAGSAPKSASEGDAETIAAKQYADLKAKAPIAAAQYFLANRKAIEAGQKKLSAS